MPSIKIEIAYRDRRDLCGNCGHPLMCHIVYPMKLNNQDIQVDTVDTIPCVGGTFRSCGCTEYQDKRKRK